MTDNETVVELFKVLATCTDTKIQKQIKKQIDFYKVDKSNELFNLIKEIQSKMIDLESRINSVSQAMLD